QPFAKLPEDVPFGRREDIGMWRPATSPDLLFHAQSLQRRRPIYPTRPGAWRAWYSAGDATKAGHDPPDRARTAAGGGRSLRTRFAGVSRLPDRARDARR